MHRIPGSVMTLKIQDSQKRSRPISSHSTAASGQAQPHLPTSAAFFGSSNGNNLQQRVNFQQQPPAQPANSRMDMDYECMSSESPAYQQISSMPPQAQQAAHLLQQPPSFNFQSMTPPAMSDETS